MVYENVIKTNGPYQAKTDGRLRIILIFDNHKQRIISYPKYIMEVYLDRYLDSDETVDHIDGNPLNNDISNLRVLKRKEHCSNDCIRNKDVVVKCTYCGKEFTIKGGELNNRNRKDKHQSGYFCSKQCTGRYGADIQNHRRTHITVERIIPEQYTNHEYQ